MNSVGMETRTCPHCGKDFDCRRSKPREFCSQECKYAARVKREEHPCPTCGKTVVTTGRYKTTYCSPACGDTAKLRPVQCECSCCGKSFTRSPSRVSPFCSAECYEAHSRRPLHERVWDHVEKTDTCWLWTGMKSPHGYGLIQSKADGERHVYQAHRIVYEAVHGPIPSGLEVCHRCDNPPCVRPEHLFLGTQADNIADMVAKDRHARGERSVSVKLTADQVREIRANTNESQRVVAQRYAVSPALIGLIRNRRVWKHL